MQSRLRLAPVLALVSSSAIAATPCYTGDPTALITTIDTVLYGANPATDLLRMYLPKPATLSSLGLKQAFGVLAIHGRGGHYNGGEMGGVCEHLAANGIACASVEYPQADGISTFVWNGYAAVNCALRWLRAHGTTYNYGGTLIGVYGMSLGANQAMWQVATEAMEITPVLHQSVIEPDCPNANDAAGVEAAVLQYGVSDLTLPTNSIYQTLLLGADHAQDPIYQTEFSPLAHLHGFRPMIMSVGDYDVTVDPANTGEWVQRLIALDAHRLTYVDPTNRSLCLPEQICGGAFTGLLQYWELGGFAHTYEVFKTAPNGPFKLTIPISYSCAVVAFFQRALTVSSPIPNR